MFCLDDYSDLSLSWRGNLSQVLAIQVRKTEIGEAEQGSPEDQ